MWGGQYRQFTDHRLEFSVKAALPIGVKWAQEFAAWVTDPSSIVEIGLSIIIVQVESQNNFDPNCPFDLKMG